MKFLIMYEDSTCFQINELSSDMVENYLQGICNIYCHIDDHYYECVINSDGSIKYFIVKSLREH